MITYNVYCDESCHLEFDKSPIMVLGAIWLDIDKYQDITKRINNIKQFYHIPVHRELKWTKVSDSLLPLYEQLINYFFDDDDLHFRGLIVDNKTDFQHEITKSYDDWYFKMYFNTLRNIIDPKEKYNIYLDIKDTRSRRKELKLHEIICNSIYDFDHSHVLKIQSIRSDEVAIMQLVDLLIGALSYNARGLSTSKSKQKLIQIIKERSGYSLSRTTLARESKFNIFHLQLEE